MPPIIFMSPRLALRGPRTLSGFRVSPRRAAHLNVVHSFSCCFSFSFLLYSPQCLRFGTLRIHASHHVGRSINMFLELVASESKTFNRVYSPQCLRFGTLRIHASHHVGRSINMFLELVASESKTFNRVPVLQISVCNVAHREHKKRLPNG